MYNASALVLEPDVIVADEPVSMLDVSIRADILNLLASLASDQSIAVVMITHDMSTVAAYSDRLAVMYLGRIVETGPSRAVLTDPQHPYTRALLSVVPVPHPSKRRPRSFSRARPRTRKDSERLQVPPLLPDGVRPLSPGGSTHVRDGSWQLAACLLAENGRCNERLELEV